MIVVAGNIAKLQNDVNTIRGTISKFELKINRIKSSVNIKIYKYR